MHDVFTHGRIMMNRTWAMPSPDTLTIKPIRELVKRYLHKADVSVDPFARNCRWATYTNDLNPDTAAEFHLDSSDFLRHLQTLGVQADVVIFDPPYSPEQMKRAYESFGLKMNGTDALRTAGWKVEKDLLNHIVKDGGKVLSFGWDSCGMGLKRNFQLLEILLVCHGGGRNDTICTVEQKVASNQNDLFALEV